MPALQKIARAGSERATFVIHIPRGKSRRRASDKHLGRPAYVSVSTRAMTLTIRGNATVVIEETIALTAGSSGCRTSSSGITCISSVGGLAPCVSSSACYSASIATYDEVACGGTPPTCTVPAGAHELSSAQNVAFGITTGVANSVNLTLSGIPTSTTLSPGDAFTSANAGIGGFDLIGPGSHTILAAARDADGNVIVGPGSPTFVVGSVSGTLAGVTASPVAPNVVLVTPPRTYGTGTASFTVRPTYAGQTTDGCAQEGANCSGATAVVDMVQLVAVQNCAATSCDGSGSDTISLYAPGDSSARATITTGSTHSLGLIADASGNLYAAETGNGVEVFKPPFSTGMSPSQTLMQTLSLLEGIAIDASGDLFGINAVAPDYSASSITECVHAASCAQIALLNLQFGEPWTMTSDGSGDIAVINNALPCSVDVYRHSNYAAPTALTGGALGSSFCFFLNYDTAGDLFVATGTAVIEYAPNLSTPTTIDLSSVTPQIGEATTDAAGDLIVEGLGSGGISTALFLEKETTLAAHAGGTIIGAPDASVTVGNYYGNNAIGAGTGVAFIQTSTQASLPSSSGAFSGYTASTLSPMGPPSGNALGNPIALVVLP